MGSEHLLSRRKTLFGLIALIGAAIFYKVLRVFHSFLHVTPKANSYGGTIEAGPLTALPPPGAPPEHIPEGRFWLVHDNDGMKVLHSSCTHLDCLFGWDEERSRFICPCHGSEFSRNGALLKGPATRPLDRFCFEIIDIEGNSKRDNFASKGAAVPVVDLLVPPHQEEEPDTASAAITPRPQFYLRVDTSKKISTAAIPS